MRLFATKTSPYARKVRIALLEKGLPFDVEWVDLRAPDHPALAHNPLGKIPVLLPPEREPLFDSSVILQYLDQVKPQPRLLPPEGEARIAMLRTEALADGLMDATVAWIQEQRRPKECQDQGLLVRLKGKIDRALGALETLCQNDRLSTGRGLFQLDAIAVLAGHGYVDLRAPQFLVPYPALGAFALAQRDRPSVRETAPE